MYEYVETGKIVHGRFSVVDVVIHHKRRALRVRCHGHASRTAPQKQTLVRGHARAVPAAMLGHGATLPPIPRHK